MVRVRKLNFITAIAVAAIMIPGSCVNLPEKELPEGENRPPRIFLDSTYLTVMEGERIVIDPQVVDPDGDPMEVTFGGWNPSGATRNTSYPGSPTWSYTTGYEDSGDYNVWMAATDGDATVQTDVFITVENLNRPPVCPVISDQTVAELETLSFVFRATDPDAEDNLKLRYSTSWQGTAPEGTTSMVLDSTTNAIHYSFTPAFGDRGDHQLIFSVSDRSLPEYTTDCPISVTVGDVLLWEELGSLPSWKGEAMVTALAVGTSGTNAPVYAGFTAFFDPLSSEHPEPVTGYGVYVYYPLAGQWQELNNGLGDYRVTGLQIDSDETLYAATFSGVFRFNGVAWEETSEGIPSVHRNIYILTMDPQERLWAGRAGLTSVRGPLYYSDDGAATWQATCTDDQCNPFPGYSEGITGVSSVYAFATDRIDGIDIHASAFRSDGTRYYRALIQSDDRGVTWRDNELNVQGSARAIAYDPAHSGRLYVGVDNQGIYRSEDGGESWDGPVLLGNVNTYSRSILSIPYSDYPYTVLVGTTQMGIWRSRDGGRNFSIQNSGLPDEVEVRVIVADPADPEHLLIGTNQYGVYRSVLP